MGLVAAYESNSVSLVLEKLIFIYPPLFLRYVDFETGVDILQNLDHDFGGLMASNHQITSEFNTLNA